MPEAIAYVMWLGERTATELYSCDISERRSSLSGDIIAELCLAVG